MLDPFRPEAPEDVERLNRLLEDIHGNFIDHVKTRRGDKLDGSVKLFTGEVWLGRRALELGLIDGIGHLRTTMKQRFGDKTTFRRYGVKRPLLSRFGAQVLSDAVQGIEERAAYARFGL